MSPPDATSGPAAEAGDSLLIRSLAVADGVDVAARAIATAGADAIVDDLHSLAAAVAASTDRLAYATVTPIEPIPFWAWGLITAAGLKSGAGLFAFAGARLGWIESLGTVQPSFIYLAHVLAYGLTGAVLVAGSRRDRRAALLGAFFLFIASSFSGRAVDVLARVAPPPLHGTAALVAALQPDAFMPLFMWLFVRGFPRRAFGSTSFFVDLTVWASAACGLGLFTVNLALAVAPGRLSWLHWLGARVPPYHYWIPTFALTFTALPYMVSRLRSAAPEERRRARLFLVGLTSGLAPMLAQAVVATSFAAYQAFATRHWMTVFGLTYLLFVSIPFTTGYAVTVDRVLDVRVIVRRALQHVLATWTARLLVVAPAAGFAFIAFTNRHASVAEVVSGRTGATLLTLVAIGAVLLTVNNRLFDLIDRRFFRQQYDARRILSTLIERSRFARTVSEWFDLVSDDIDRALHADGVRLLVRNDARQKYVALDGSIAPLRFGSALVGLLEADAAALPVNLENPRSPMHLLPADSRLWLVDSGARLLVPLPTGDHGVVGILVLGEKRSDLPYSADDRLMLTTLATSGGLVIENQMLRSAAQSSSSQQISLHDEVARECVQCGAIVPFDMTVCTCGGALADALLPPVLLGKFRVDRRAGAGAMGVVYRATDVTLDRAVAIKTLPKVSIDQAARLRREARAMATVQHRHLALIYGAESWRGTPLLIVEYLRRGTLADRLRKGPLAPADVVTIGLAVSGALESLHEAGILHRDVKPSNIGFADDGTPKLLDFGLARLTTDIDAPRGHATGAPLRVDVSQSLHATRDIAGTPLYMSPEAWRGGTPDASFDLWSLGVVLYEALAGIRPFEHPEQAFATGALGAPDVRTRRPECTAELSALLAAALSFDPRRRPRTAREFRSGLERATTGIKERMA